jgi:hypothetical protein
VTNPAYSVTAVTATRSLLFAGCGKVKFTTVGSNAVLLGGSGFVYGSTDEALASLNPGASFEIEFKADAEVYAVCPPGQASSIRIIRWF